MPLPQKNFSMVTYVDNSGTPWNIRAEAPSYADAINGHADPVGTQNRWVTSPRNRPRRALYVDDTTFRKVTPIIFTPTAAAAITPGDILAVPQPGSATDINYTFKGMIEERKAKNLQDSPNLPDHA